MVDHRVHEHLGGHRHFPAVPRQEGEPRGEPPASAAATRGTWSNDSSERLMPTVKFFGLDFSESVFTLFSQGGLILTFVVMLCRKWRRAEAHLLGKLWAAGFFIWMQVLLLGNALPLIDPGNLFPSRAFTRMVRLMPDWRPEAAEAVLMSGVYGLFTLVLMFILGGIITPSADSQIRGWRRARKQGARSLPVLADAATGFWFVMVMALAGAGGWFLFTRALVESRWFPGHEVPWSVFGCFVAVLFGCGVGFQVLLESKGGRFVGLAAIFIGVVPLMVGAVLVPISERMIPLATWLIAISPVSLPFYASGTLLSLAEIPEQAGRAVPRAFYFWLMVSCLVTLWVALRLWAGRKAMAASVLDEPSEGA